MFIFQSAVTTVKTQKIDQGRADAKRAPDDSFRKRMMELKERGDFMQAAIEICRGKTCREISDNLKISIQIFGTKKTFDMLEPLARQNSNLAHSMSWQFASYYADLEVHQQLRYSEIKNNELERARANWKNEIADRLASFVASKIGEPEKTQNIQTAQLPRPTQNESFAVISAKIDTRGKSQSSTGSTDLMFVHIMGIKTGANTNELPTTAEVPSVQQQPVSNTNAPQNANSCPENSSTTNESVVVEKQDIDFVSSQKPVKTKLPKFPEFLAPVTGNIHPESYQQESIFSKFSVSAPKPTGNERKSYPQAYREASFIADFVLLPTKKSNKSKKQKTEKKHIQLKPGTSKPRQLLIKLCRSILKIEKPKLSKLISLTFSYLNNPKERFKDLKIKFKDSEKRLKSRLADLKKKLEKLKLKITNAKTEKEKTLMRQKLEKIKQEIKFIETILAKLRSMKKELLSSKLLKARINEFVKTIKKFSALLKKDKETENLLKRVLYMLFVVKLLILYGSFVKRGKSYGKNRKVAVPVSAGTKDSVFLSGKAGWKSKR